MEQKQLAFWLLLIGYLLLLNGVSFLAYGIDKWKAKRAHWRISEKTLLLLAAVGGSAGAFLGMKLFHHKTLKRKFSVGVPVLLALHGVLVLAVIWYFRRGVF